MLAATLVVATYPVLLFVSVFGPIVRFVRSAARLMIRVSGLSFPPSRPAAVTPEASIERVHQSIERVGRMLVESISTPDEPTRPGRASLVADAAAESTPNALQKTTNNGRRPDCG